MLFDERHSCPYCGRNSKKHFKYIFKGKEPYKGTHKIINEKKRTYYRNEEDARTKNLQTFYNYTLWDGQTYKMKCGYFCTNRCAQNWANEIFAKYFSASLGENDETNN